MASVARPPCADGTAYASLLSLHESDARSTALAGMVARGRVKARLGQKSTYEPLQVQLRLILSLVRSLRLVESCRRDFVLLGAHPPLSSAWTRRLEREGVQMHRTEPIILGNPSTDKLHAWRLTQYSRVVVVDADVMALRPFDELFQQQPAEFIAAHHESDFAQSLCDIPLPARVLGALFVVRPAAARFEQLVGAAKVFATRHPKLFGKFSEQQFLACELKNLTRALPCGWLYNTHAPMSTSCRSMAGARSPQTCLRAFLKACMRHNNVFSGERQRQRACEAAVRHMEAACLGAGGREPQYHAVRAVHFKGANKPWTARSKDCEKVRDGAMLRRADDAMPTRGDGGNSSTASSSSPHLVVVDPLADEVAWHTAEQRCIVARTGSPLLWASGEPVVHERCCSFWLVVSAHWFGLLDTLRARMYRASRGWCAQGIPELPSTIETRPRPALLGSLHAMTRLSAEAPRGNASVGRWCCASTCGVCRQEGVCRRRPGGPARCCPARHARAEEGDHRG